MPPPFLFQFESLLAPWIQKGGWFAALAIVVILITALGKVLIAPLFEWTKEKWVRRVTIEDGLRKKMEDMLERLSKLESFADRVQDEIPDIGANLLTEMDKPEVNRDTVRFYARRLIDFRGVDDKPHVAGRHVDSQAFNLATLHFV